MKHLFLILFLVCSQYSFSQNCKKTIVYFNNDNSDLTHKTRKLLDSIISSLDTSQKYLIELYGHTDALHTEEYNKTLGLQRVYNVKSFIEKKGLKNLIWFEKTYGESKPQADNAKRRSRKLNRRVELFVVPLDSSDGLTIKGDDSLSAFVKYSFFASCGYCESNARLIVLKSIDPITQVSTTYKSRIHMDCFPEGICYEATFKIPYKVFNPTAKLKIPKPIFVESCSVTNRDSLEIDPSSTRYDVSYDTTSHEYIIHAPCYSSYSSFCCGTKSVCKLYRLDFPTSIRYHYFRVYDAADSLTGVKDSIRYHLCTFIDSLYSIGKINGRYAHLTCRFDSLITGAIINENDLIKTVHIVTIEEKYYVPFDYAETTLFVKVPKKLSPDTVGFYLEKYDYIIPIQDTFKKGYKSPLLDYEHSIGITKGGKRYALPYKKLRIRKNERKNMIKIKIRKLVLNKKHAI